MNVATVAANSTASPGKLPLLPTSGVAAAAPSSGLSLFPALLNTLTEIGPPEPPSPALTRKGDSPVGKQGKKNKQKQDPKDELQGDLPLMFFIETPLAVMRNAPIVIEQPSCSSATPGPSGRPMVEPPSPRDTPALNEGQVQPAFTPLIKTPPMPTAPMATRIAFIAQIIPVNSSVGLAPASARGPLQTAAPAEPAKDLTGSAAPHETATRSLEPGDSVVPGALGSTTVNENAPKPQQVEAISRPEPAAMAPEDTSVKLQPAGERPPETNPVLRGEISSHTSENPQRRSELPPSGKMAGSERPTLEVGSVATPGPTFSPVNAKGNSSSVLPDRDPAPVRVEQKAEIGSHVQAPPTREISLRLAEADSAKVDVKLTERAGKVQVAVRTEDRELARSLQSDLGELVGRLERRGYTTETWTPGARLSNSSTRETAGSRGGGDTSGWTQQQHQQQRGRGDSHRRQPIQWETEMGRNFKFIEGESEANDDKSN